MLGVWMSYAGALLGCVRTVGAGSNVLLHKAQLVCLTWCCIVECAVCPAGPHQGPCCSHGDCDGLSEQECVQQHHEGSGGSGAQVGAGAHGLAFQQTDNLGCGQRGWTWRGWASPGLAPATAE